VPANSSSHASGLRKYFFILDKTGMQQTRRHFIKRISLGTAFLLTGCFESLSAKAVLAMLSNVVFRFVVASDGHYGQADTDFEGFFARLTAQINVFHQQRPLDACIINGDIIHDETSLLNASKQKLDALKMPYFVTQGNHDHATPEYWQNVWQVPLNYEAKFKQNTLLMMTTSNEKGEYLSPDLNWLDTVLAAHKKQSNVFLFLHIPQYKWTKYAIDTPGFFEVVNKHKNVRAAFHGHEHDEDGIKVKDGIPYVFDAHFGGNWGTAYRGFRVVEVMKDNSIITYMMNPTEKLIEAAL
jgi:predicted phosphodiesterase